jgi:predicted ferric reductase
VRNDEEALFVDEIERAATKHASFHPHMSYSDRDGVLTLAQITAACTGAVAGKEVYMCGPSAMTESFQRGLHNLGVSLDRIHFEYFNFR